MIDMDKEIITTKQAIFLVIIFIIGTSIILTGITMAKQDIWISIILALSAIMPMIFVYCKIISLFPGKNLFEILDIIYGKIIGRIFSLLYILYFLYLGALCVRNITEFIQVVSFRLTPQYFSGIWIILVSSYMVRSGIEVFGRWANLVCVLLLALILIMTLLSMSQLDFQNVLPVLYEGWSPVLKSTINIFSFPFGEIVVFLALFNTLKEPKKTFKILSLSTLIGGGLILIVSIRSVLILGTPLVDNTSFPTYYANTIITIGSFLENVAIFSSIILLLAGFAKFTTCLFAICLGLKHVFNTKEYGIYSLPVGLIVLIISQLLFSSTMEMMENFDYYHYYALPFQTVLPLITLVFSCRKKNKV
ncbi:MAG: endospore germination permease [Tissierella sp.]|nr:endospore germination permease [Tissierella sp.]